MSKLIGTKPNQVPTNGDLGTMAYTDYNDIAANNGLSVDRAIRSNTDVKNIVASGPIWFNLGDGPFQTYVDINYTGKGCWALVAKPGGTNMGDQTFQSGQYDVFDVNAHGDMTNTSVVTSSKDQVSRSNCNGLFRLNGRAYIMAVEIVSMGHCSGAHNGDKYFIKKLTNQNSFDAWHGMFLNSLWGSDDATVCNYTAPNEGTAFKLTGSDWAQTWVGDFTDFTDTAGTGDLKDWDCNDEVSYGMPGNTMKVSRHGPIVTDWVGGCQWLRGLRSNGYHTNWNSSGLVWVKI